MNMTAPNNEKIVAPPHSTQLTHPKYRADIDGLRAIAVLAVVGFHAFPDWVKGGFVGVDVFFVISGFLISTIILESLEDNTFSFITFYSRRIKRIFPALLVVLAFCLSFGWFSLLGDEYKQLGKHVAGGAGFISNFLFWGESGYFDNEAERKPLLHLWSLGIEEQFYIVWPFVLWFAYKKNYNLLKVTLILALFSFALNMRGIRSDAIGTFYSPQTRFWELLCGTTLAWLTLFYKQNLLAVQYGDSGWFKRFVNREPSQGRRVETVLRNIQSVVGLLLIVYAVCALAKDSHFPGAWALIPVVGAVLVISAGPQAWLNRVVLSRRILVWFGLISFPLYLWHWPLLSFARIVESAEPAPSIRVAAVIVSIVLAWLTYHLVEKPARFGKRDRLKTIIFSVSMIVVGCTGYAVFIGDGLGFRQALKRAEATAALSQGYPHEPFHNPNCDSAFPVFKGFSSCLLSKNSSPEILIVGDSHGQQFYKSFSSKLNHKSVMNIGMFSCLPFSSSTLAASNDCAVRQKTFLDFISSNRSIKTIYVSGYWAYLEAGEFDQRAGYRLPIQITPEAALSFQNNGKYFLSELVKTRKSIVLLGDIPELEFDIRTCLGVRPLTITKNIRASCTVDQKKYEARNQGSQSALLRVVNSSEGVIFFDTKNLFCDGEKCRGLQGGIPLYYNSDHLTVYGANYVVDAVLKQHPVR